jgi:hypothetical protein
MKKISLLALLSTLGILILSSQSVFAGEPPPPSGIPTLNEWGMIATTVSLGAAGIYILLKRK